MDEGVGGQGPLSPIASLSPTSGHCYTKDKHSMQGSPAHTSHHNKESPGTPTRMVKDLCRALYLFFWTWSYP